MSKYSELLGLLKEDVDKMVEQRVAERMESIIEALMPSILQHVTNNIDLYQGPLDDGAYIPELNKMQFVMKTDVGTVQYISRPFITVDAANYNHKQLMRTNDINTINYRISELESKISIYESKH